MCAPLGLMGHVSIVPEGSSGGLTSAKMIPCMNASVDVDEDSYGRCGGREKCRVRLSFSFMPTSTFRIGEGPLLVRFIIPGISWMGWEIEGLFVTHVGIPTGPSFEMTLEGFVDGIRNIGRFHTLDLQVDADDSGDPEEFEWLDDDTLEFEWPDD